jgi:hypothetical protein
MYKCVTTQVDSSLTDLFTSSWSLSHIDLCHFKVSVLAPLQWGHQTLLCFGFPTYPHTSRMCSPLIMWPKSNSIAVFALDLNSTHEGEHMILGLLSLANSRYLFWFHVYAHFYNKLCEKVVSVGIYTILLPLPPFSFSFFLGDIVSLYSSGWSWTCDPPGIWVWITTPGPPLVSWIQSS